jgi:hypothetical protein
MRDSATSLAVAALACAFALACPGGAAAEVSDTHLIDGPSADVVGAADAAMAADGSGGVVYLRKLGGRNHVFVARFVGGSWGAPQQVDIGQAFDSSWPRIAAGVDGRLLVTWVQEFGVGSDRMFSATLDPGAQGFQVPVPVDFNVGEATSTYPDLAMNAGGQAYLTYLVVTDTSALNPPGYVGASVRVARYNNRLWSLSGSAANRNPASPVRLPTEASGPRVGIDLRGNGLVAWQEPDDEFIDRVWARRLFGGSVGVPLQVSPSTWADGPVRGAADAFALDVAGFGQAAVALRQQPGQSTALGAPRLFVGEMADAFSAEGGAFGAPRLVDGGVKAGLGPPSAAVEPNGGFLAGFSAAGTALLAGGDSRELGPLQRADGGGGVVVGEPLVDLSETGAAVSAWREQRGGAGTIGVQERRADGVAEPAALSTLRGGAVADLRLGGSGLGDALLTWTQGSGANAQVAAAFVDAPPDPFNVETPEGWKRQEKVTLHWPEATNAISRVRYSLSVDDEPIGKPTRRLFAQLKSNRIGDGRHRVQVFAIDDSGQQTGSRNAVLLIDRRPPRVKLRRHGRRLSVVLADGARRESSGVKGSAVKIAFGEGGAPSGARRHVYKRSGSFRVTIRARDRAGNLSELRRKVRIG